MKREPVTNATTVTETATAAKTVKPHESVIGNVSENFPISGVSW